MATFVAGVAGLLGVVAGLEAAVLIGWLGGKSLPRVVLAGGMALLWGLLGVRLWDAGLGWALPAYLGLAFACVVLAVVDATTRLLPNRVTYPAFPALALLLLGASAGVGDLDRWTRALLAAVVVGGLFLLLRVAYPPGMGLGDVKLAPTLAFALGWLSWPSVLAGIFAAFLLGGLSALVAVVAFRANRKTMLPFGPFLVAGTVLAILAYQPPGG